MQHPDFEEAIVLATAISDEPGRAWTLTEIGKRQGHVDIEPNDVVESLGKIKESLGPSFSRSLNGYLAIVLAAAGNFPSAEAYIAAAETNHVNADLRFVLAREKAGRGVDPTPDLAVVRSDIEAWRRRFPHYATEAYAELATVVYETTGTYPSSDLAQAEALLAESERQYPTDRVISGWHGDIAQAFASCGNIDGAHRHEQQILSHSPIETTIHRATTRRHMTEKEIQFGNVDRAAATGRETIQMIEETPVEPPYLIDHLLHEQTSGVATLWPLVGIAEAKAGLDPSPSFQHAEEAIQTIDDGYWTARALATLAHAKKASGRDANLTLNRAWVTLVDMPKRSDYDGFDKLQRLFGLEELAVAFIDLGDLVSAREMLQDLGRASSQEGLDASSEMALLHARLAVAEIRSQATAFSN